MTRRKPTARAAFVRLLWQQPIVAIPFGVFFSLIFGGFPGTVPNATLISLVFAYVVGIAVWAVRWPILRDHSVVKDWKQPALYYAVASIGASLLAALIVDLTLVPGFVTRSGRNVAVVLAFATLFCALFMGIGMAMSFYRDAMDKAKAEQELDMARRIQRSFLLSSFPERPRLELHAVNWSSRHVSGDFYDVVPVGDDGVLIAVADVSGKGVPAALLSSMLQASLRTQAGAGIAVAEMMRKINTLVCQRQDTGQFATFFLAWVDERSLTLRYTNAGHNFPVLLARDGRRLLDQGGTVVGVMEHLDWAEGEVALAPGDRLVLYTDGVTEAADTGGEMYGEERLYALLDALPRHLDAAGVVEGVLAGLRRHLGDAEPGDDVTVLALRVRDATPGAAPAHGRC